MPFSEQHTVEDSIITFLQARLGYEYIPAVEFAKLREYKNECLITPLIISSLKKINKIDDHIAGNILKELQKIDSNEEFSKALRDGISLKNSQTGKMQVYKIVDYNRVENNHISFTNQFFFQGITENIRLDLLIFLNGIPIINIEAKSPVSADAESYEQAIKQIKRYEKEAPKLFVPNTFNIATNGIDTVYGATYAPAQYFSHWKDEQLEQAFEGNKLNMTLQSLLSKEHLLDIIKNFIIFEKEDNKTIKKICRYQQFRAANKILSRVLESQQEEKNNPHNKQNRKGLIWHTQGSGKSLTMFFTAWKLRFAEELKNPKVFILVDRIDLDDQIYNTFVRCGGENVIRVTSRQDLKEKITSPERGIFISTMQKFSDDLQDIIHELDENVIILSDEAHRNNEGVSAMYLRETFQNAYYFGFTGTPIDKKMRNTFRNFSSPSERYLDYYSIQQAIEDKATLPVTYQARLSQFFVPEQTIDYDITQATQVNDKQRDTLAKKYITTEQFIKNEKRIAAIAKDIAEHFKLYVEPKGFKAQVVCYDREATALMKQELDKLLPTEYSAVVYSDGEPNNDNKLLKQYSTTKQEKDAIVSSFKNTTSKLKLLLVCDMLLTGFDAPIEQIMYLDKPLKDHNLLQAIARTNRVTPHKECGIIIDYFGITNNLTDALKFDEDVVHSALIPLDTYKEEFKHVFQEVLDIFTGIKKEDNSSDNLNRCLNIFRNNKEKQQFFVTKYQRIKTLYELLSPDTFLVHYTPTFIWFTEVYLAYTKEFKLYDIDDKNIFDEYGKTVQDIIRKSIDFQGIIKNYETIHLNDILFNQQLAKLDEERQRMALEKAIQESINEHIEFNPNYETFANRLSKIKSQFDNKQISLQEHLKMLKELAATIKEEQHQDKKLGLTKREYELYSLTKQFIINPDTNTLIQVIKTLSRLLENILDPGWQETSKKEELTKHIKQIIQKLFLKEYKETIKITEFSSLMSKLETFILRKF